MNEDLMDIFIEEAEGNIKEMENQVGELSSADEGVLGAMRRCAHTMKGSAAIMGLDTMSELSKHIEEVFRRLEDGSMEYSEELGSLLDDGVKGIRAEFEKVKTSKEDGAEGTTKLIERFNEIV